MAGQSRSPFVNIGQGGLQGIHAMMEANQSSAKTGLERAQTYTTGINAQRMLTALQIIAKNQAAAAGSAGG